MLLSAGEHQTAKDTSMNSMNSEVALTEEETHERMIARPVFEDLS